MWKCDDYDDATKLLMGWAVKGMGWGMQEMGQAMGGRGLVAPETVNNCLFCFLGKGGSDLEGRLGGSNLIQFKLENIKVNTKRLQYNNYHYIEKKNEIRPTPIQ